MVKKQKASIKYNLVMLIEKGGNNMSNGNNKGQEQRDLPSERVEKNSRDVPPADFQPPPPPPKQSDKK